ncbi:hypothetical protein C3408_22335 [Candidatus Pantoea alvi]|uniref:hypothetical protein n=1 Tax=Pantoea septica TaxID=472695 RepID=UPI000CDDDFE9|nr:hypothetical protein [Pantoea septica]POW54597.1 hypothetical protein C3408_22335 [Pantoea alvi]
MSLLSTLASLSSIKQKLIIGGAVIGVIGLCASGIWIEEKRLSRAQTTINGLNETVGQQKQTIADKDATIKQQDLKMAAINQNESAYHQQEANDDRKQAELAAENDVLKKKMRAELGKSGISQPIPSDTKRMLSEAISQLNAGSGADGQPGS